VREAWPGRGFAASLLTGEVAAAAPLLIESLMVNGVLFSDGTESDAIAFDPA